MNFVGFLWGVAIYLIALIAARLTSERLRKRIRSWMLDPRRADHEKFERHAVALIAKLRSNSQDEK